MIDWDPWTYFNSPSLKIIKRLWTLKHENNIDIHQPILENDEVRWSLFWENSSKHVNFYYGHDCEFQMEVKYIDNEYDYFINPTDNQIIEHMNWITKWC